MQKSQIPGKFQIPFADSADPAYIRSLLYSTSDPKRASQTLGFPPDTFDPIAAGGAPADGRDVNSVLNLATGWGWWLGAGGPITYDAAWSALVNGYPEGAIIASAVTAGKYYLSTADDNVTDPDDPATSAGWRLYKRIRLGAATTFYVDVGTGSDNNPGTSGSPWKTLTYAWNTIRDQYDLAGFGATVAVADGAYAALGCSGRLVGGSLTFQGNLSTPTNVTIHIASGDCISAYDGASIAVRGFSVQSGGSGGTSHGLHAFYGGKISYDTMSFSSCGDSHLFSEASGQINCTGAYSIAGGAPAHAWAGSDGYIGIVGIATINVVPTQAFSVGFARASVTGVVDIFNDTFSGAASGPRYNASGNGVVNTEGAGETSIPGSTSGSSVSGGQLV